MALKVRLNKMDKHTKTYARAHSSTCSLEKHNSSFIALLPLQAKPFLLRLASFMFLRYSTSHNHLLRCISKWLHLHCPRKALVEWSSRKSKNADLQVTIDLKKLPFLSLVSVRGWHPMFSWLFFSAKCNLIVVNNNVFVFIGVNQ